MKKRKVMKEISEDIAELNDFIILVSDGLTHRIDIQNERWASMLSLYKNLSERLGLIEDFFKTRLQKK